ncbi:MAG TPA: cytochrome c-type biogenesis CcmF C-terminal domain-containing protein, partial [Acidimicrobiales bacterium]|nr:cytochrome c-type biogenesis CcmF C-terminal domain-containing protein [Acidimicrobiales bacterium]
LSVRASRHHGSGAWRGLVGRTNGGMVVHLGVVVFAVGLVAATSFIQRTELALPLGTVVHFDGHTFVYEGTRTVNTAQRRATEAAIKVDGGGLFFPAVSQYGGANSEVVGTPAIDSSVFGDVYLTFDSIGGTGPASGAQLIPDLPANAIGAGVVVEPLVAWLWAGGLLIGVGGLLALLPGGRRRPTDPVSGPAPATTTAGGPGGPDVEPNAGTAVRVVARDRDPVAETESPAPVGAGHAEPVGTEAP